MKHEPLAETLCQKAVIKNVSSLKITYLKLMGANPVLKLS